MAKRKTHWIDAVQSPVSLTQGSISEFTLVTESELENLSASGLTLVRIVGEMVLTRTSGAPVTKWAIWIAPNYVGVTLPTIWDEDTYQRARVLHTGIDAFPSNCVQTHRFTVDVRAQRKVSQGVFINLSFENDSQVGVMALIYHLRLLFKLP